MESDDDDVDLCSTCGDEKEEGEGMCARCYADRDAGREPGDHGEECKQDGDACPFCREADAIRMESPGSWSCEECGNRWESE